MNYFSTFRNLEKIAAKGLDDFFAENYSEQFLIENMREDVSLELIKIAYTENNIQIVGKEEIKGEEYWENKFSSLTNNTDEVRIEQFLHETGALASPNLGGWYMQPCNGNEDYNYMVVLKYFEKHPSKLVMQNRFERFYKAYVRNEFSILHNHFITEIESTSEFADDKQKPSEKFIEIMRTLNELKELFVGKKDTDLPVYKNKIYETIITELETLYEKLKTEFPLLYRLHQAKIEERYFLDKISIHPNQEALLYLFNELKESLILRKTDNRKLSYDEFAESLSKIFYFLTKKGESPVYLPSSLAKKLASLKLNEKDEMVIKFKAAVNQLIDVLLKLK